MNAGAITPVNGSQAKDESYHSNRLKEAAPEMLVLLLRVSESTSHLPALYESADAATAFIDRIIRGERNNEH